MSSNAFSVEADSHTAVGNYDVFFDDPLLFCFIISLLHNTRFITFGMIEHESFVKPVCLDECSSE